MGEPMLPDVIKSAMQGMFPSVLVTCALEGTPNITVISQVHYVDSRHVALSHQFFSKTYRNIRENPQVSVRITCPQQRRFWELKLRFDHAETDGPVFDQMDMQIEAIASMTGMSGIFKLIAADIYEVLEVTELIAPPPGQGMPGQGMPAGAGG